MRVERKVRLRESVKCYKKHKLEAVVPLPITNIRGGVVDGKASNWGDGKASVTHALVLLPVIVVAPVVGLHGACSKSPKSSSSSSSGVLVSNNTSPEAAVD